MSQEEVAQLWEKLKQEFFPRYRIDSPQYPHSFERRGNATAIIYGAAIPFDFLLVVREPDESKVSSSFLRLSDSDDYVLVWVQRVAPAFRMWSHKGQKETSNEGTLFEPGCTV